MMSCLRFIGGLVLAVVWPLSFRSGEPLVLVVVGAVGFTFIGIAALLANAMAPASAGAR